MRTICIDEALSLQTTGHSSKGNQLKWETEGLWYKADGLGYESLSEILVSKLLSLSNVSNFVAYEPIRILWQNRNYDGCVSRNFRKEGWQLITIEKLYRRYTGLSLAQEMAKYRNTVDRIQMLVFFAEKITGLSGFGHYLTVMLEMDAFFLNEDRHTNNIAVIMNASTGEFDYCPYFDFGAALFSDLLVDYPLSKSAEQCWEIITAKPFSEDFDEQAAAACELYKSGFYFTADKQTLKKECETVLERYKANSVRDDAKLITERVEEVLSMQIRKYGNYMGK